MGEPMLVQELISVLAQYPDDMLITFGSTKYRKRPLIFYRTKIRGEKHLSIELNELDGSDPDMTEWSRRITVGDLIRNLSGCEDWEVSFTGAVDGSPIVLDKIVPVIAIDLDQPTPPNFRVIEDDNNGLIIVPVQPEE